MRRHGGCKRDKEAQMEDRIYGIRAFSQVEKSHIR